MKSLRLNAIASFISPTDKVIDIGCDHAYLPIFLKQKKIGEKIIASDIHQKALEAAKKNILKNNLGNEIPLYLSDGLKNISDKDIDTIILAGMGAHTIIDILSDIQDFPIQKIIIQSNNDLGVLRKKMRQFHFYLQKEKIVYERKHYYVIGVYTKKVKHLSLREKCFGIYDASNKDYYISLYNELTAINKKLSFKKRK